MFLNLTSFFTKSFSLLIEMSYSCYPIAMFVTHHSASITTYYFANRDGMDSNPDSDSDWLDSDSDSDSKKKGWIRIRIRIQGRTGGFGFGFEMPGFAHHWSPPALFGTII